MIIGITGTLGAGKGTIVDYLKTRGFTHYSVREFLVEELQRRGLTITRDAMVLVANDLREQYGPGYIILELHRRAKKQGGHAVIESIRTVGEIETLRKEGNFLLFAIDADPHIRYKRIIERASTTDKVSFERFMEDERKESISKDPRKQNLPACIRQADHFFKNDGTIEELHKKVSHTIKNIPT